jgi:predicted component of type VI protein secretion system
MANICRGKEERGIMDPLKLDWQIHGEPHTYTVDSTKQVCIGRHGDCDIVVPSPIISRRHALIFREGSSFYLQNISRTNDIWLDDGVRLSEGQRASLRPGDGFKIGSVQFEVADPPQAASESMSINIVCSHCQRRVPYSAGAFCPHCGTSLDTGVTVYGGS